LFDKATTFKKHASREVQPVLDEGLPIIQRHIAALETMMVALDRAQG
jgi:hypothetical protein